MLNEQLHYFNPMKRGSVIRPFRMGWDRTRGHGAPEASNSPSLNQRSNSEKVSKKNEWRKGSVAGLSKTRLEVSAGAAWKDSQF